jgi:hypothetical protein
LGFQLRRSLTSARTMAQQSLPGVVVARCGRCSQLSTT